MRSYVILLLLLLTSCALTPIDVRNQGARSDFKSAKTPSAVANCIARNADEAKRPLQATIRDGAEGAYDVHITKPGLGNALTAEVLPTQNGSAITTWWMPHMGSNVSPELMRGCE